MKKNLNYLITYTCISITITLITSSIFNLLAGQDIWYYTRWLLMIVTIALLYAIQFGIINKLELKRATVYYAVEFMLWYFGLGAYIFGSRWMGLGIKNIIVYSGIMVVSFILLYRYNRINLQICAAEINKVLEEKEF